MTHPPFDKVDPFVQDFCRIQAPGRGQASAQGIGQGFILSPDGYILTSAHLVRGASSVSVMLSDQSMFKAKVVGRDPRSDLALLKIVGRAARSDGRRGAARVGSVRRHPRLAGEPGELGADPLAEAALRPGNRLRCIRPDRHRDYQSRRRAARSRRHGVPATAIAKGKRGVQ
ncbi:MAG: trypsin-like peptidase domain-containing protein [Betaproteobacteria bacterium]|nr:trypsin-like peptidase domain-containing protein [Betaproteobacteria bacterium]